MLKSKMLRRTYGHMRDKYSNEELHNLYCSHIIIMIKFKRMQQIEYRIYLKENKKCIHNLRALALKKKQCLTRWTACIVIMMMQCTASKSLDLRKTGSEGVDLSL
jgi:hypothetical protein